MPYFSYLRGLSKASCIAWDGIRAANYADRAGVNAQIEV